MKEIDALGKACPIPVVLTKHEIDAGERLIVTKVDNTVAVENLIRLGESQGYTATVQEAAGVFEVMLSESGEARTTRNAVPEQRNEASAAHAPSWALFVGGEHLGRGADELGDTLATMFFYTLAQSGDLPAAILFVNGGVKLPTENDEIVGHLKTLADLGCEILVCGTCLNYYGLKEKLQVGTVSNMYEILQRLQNTAKVITL